MKLLKSRLFWRTVWVMAPIASILFGAYLWTLDRQLNRAFQQKEQFLPTRVYADGVKVASPMPRQVLLDRLHALGYTAQKLQDSDLVIRLHPVDYPWFLLSDGDPTFDIKDQPITLHFDRPEKDALLRSIEVGGKEIPDFYLEPELVATLARSGNLGAVRQIRELVQFQDIPASVWKAIISVEDPHFMEHKGLDPRGIARALWVDLKTRSFAQGGSTITLQLVKNLMARHSKNVFRKVNEAFLALLLEGRYDKDQILERYLNEVYLGSVANLEVHGVAEGAEHFFGKKLESLNLGEIALMAGLIRGPAYYSPYRHWARAIERQRFVLKKMAENGQIAQAEATAAMKLPIHLAPPQLVANKAPYFVDFVKAELIRQLKDKLSEQEVTEQGFRVYTTLDMTMNSAAQRAVADGVGALQKRFKLGAENRLEGALASVDQSTGYLRALIGGSSYAQSTFNRILNMKRQVGSTFKPFVYLTAFEKGYDPAGVAYGPGHPAEDGHWTLLYDHGRQSWTPRNYEREFLGWIDFRKALSNSINTVAAKLGYEIGIPNVISTARALGVESDLPGVPSLSLGVAELSPIELLRAYASIANHGVADDLTVLRAVLRDDGSTFAWFKYNPRQVFDPAATDLLTDTLQSVFTDGTAQSARALGFDRPAAGKTGTTSLHRDSWFAGYTPQLTTVVWVGLDQDVKEGKGAKGKRDPKLNLSGATSALPIWVSYMKSALESDPPAQFPESPLLTNVGIDTHTGQEASFSCPSSQVVTERYIRGKEPQSKSCEPGWPPEVPKTVANE